MNRRRSTLIVILSTLSAWMGCGSGEPNGVTSPKATPVVSAPPPPLSSPQPAATKEPGFSIRPGTFRLGPEDSGIQLIAESKGKSGGLVDATRFVEWKVEPEGVARIDRNGYLKPAGAGKATVKATWNGETQAATFEVAQSVRRAWNFGEDIVPILTRAGCNTGSCHGRADGQNGFHLSLFGYDAEGDHQAITRDASGRRISRIDPLQSLFLAKATGKVPHAGGPRLIEGTDSHATVVAWLKDAAPFKSDESRGGLVGVEVFPADARLDEPGPQQLRVVAKFADGGERDVTRLAIYKVNDDSALSIDPATGLAKLLKRAEADLTVRYKSKVLTARISTNINPDLKYDFSKLTANNLIDRELFKRLESLNVPPSPQASDAAFLRRVSLDLSGEQPLPEQVRAFLADKDPEKRAKLIDKLLASREFTLFWKIKFGDLLQITSARFNNGAGAYQAWLGEQLIANTPWDQSVKTLLTALGSPTEMGGGAANYGLDGPDAKAMAEQTAQRFMGLRFRCAQCHDHPFDIWTQDDYYGLAAFFAKVQRGAPGPGGMMNVKVEIKVDPKGTVEHQRTHKPASPMLLGGKVVDIKPELDPRKVLADWMTSPDNPYFAKASVNYIWAQFFGKGIADPADDLSKANPPVHPELLDALAKHFVERKFDIKALIRTIVTSQAYGLSSGTVPGNESDMRLFSHQIPRPLTAHQMADAIAQATDVANRYSTRAGDLRRAIDVFDPATASSILDTFGRCNRQVGCASVATPPLSLRQSLLLISGDVIESKVSSLNGYLANLLELSPESDEIVENLYMRVICRPPTPEELSRWSAELKQATSLREASEDLFWSLLNSKEFSFNH